MTQGESKRVLDLESGEKDFCSSLPFFFFFNVLFFVTKTE